MTNNEAIRILGNLSLYHDDDNEICWALDVAIGAIKRDTKVDDITFHWNDNKSNFVAACNAFEEILKVYGRGVEE